MADNPAQYLFIRGPTLSPSLHFIQIPSSAITIIYKLLPFASYPLLTSFTCLNAIYEGSYSISAFYSNPHSVLFIREGVLLCLYICFHFLLKCKPNSLPFMGVARSYSVSISTFCSNPNSIPIYRGRGSILS